MNIFFKAMILIGFLISTPTYATNSVDMKSAIDKHIKNRVFGRRNQPFKLFVASENIDDFGDFEVLEKSLPLLTGIQFERVTDSDADSTILSSDNVVELLGQEPFVNELMDRFYCDGIVSAEVCRKRTSIFKENGTTGRPSLSYKIHNGEIISYFGMYKNTIGGDLNYPYKPVGLFYAYLAHQRAENIGFPSLLSSSTREFLAALEYMKENSDLTPFDKALITELYSKKINHFQIF